MKLILIAILILISGCLPQPCIEDQPMNMQYNYHWAYADDEGRIKYVVQDRAFGKCGIHTIKTTYLTKEEWER